MATPPELISDAITEIFLRLPPEEPVHLVRAALVCRSWRQILTGRDFLRRYRTLHRAPPMLGFLDNLLMRDDHNISRFSPATEAASPFRHRAFDRIEWRVLDCRHGRVLFGRFADRVDLVVWDPITGYHQGLPDPGLPGVGAFYTAAVLCAVRSCDHLDCNGGPFRVVLVGLNLDLETAVRARHYSSESGSWIASAHLDADLLLLPVTKRPTLVGDDIYFPLMSDSVILRYDMERNRLSSIQLPAAHANEGRIVVMPMEDGSLGLACVNRSTLCLWSTNVNPEGIAGWVRCRDIVLITGIPSDGEAHVIVFAEGLGIIYGAPEVGLFTVDLKCGQQRKVGDPGIYSAKTAIYPFMSFYTPDCISGKFLLFFF